MLCEKVAARLRARLHAAEAVSPGRPADGDRRRRRRHRADGRRICTRSRSTEGRRLGRVARARAVGQRVHPQAAHALRGRGRWRDEESLTEKLRFLQREFERMPQRRRSAGCRSARRSGRPSSPRWTSPAPTSSRRPPTATPVRRLLKTHRERIAAVIRPDRVRPVAAAPAPWTLHLEALNDSTSDGGT